MMQCLQIKCFTGARTKRGFLNRFGRRAEPTDTEYTSLQDIPTISAQEHPDTHQVDEPTDTEYASLQDIPTIQAQEHPDTHQVSQNTTSPVVHH